jgi:hypothetical protein
MDFDPAIATRVMTIAFRLTDITEEEGIPPTLPVRTLRFLPSRRSKFHSAGALAQRKPSLRPVGASRA